MAMRGCPPHCNFPEYDTLRLKAMLKKCKPEGDCLVWQGARDKAGYGRTSYRYRKGITAHRAVWLASGNNIPQGTELDHLCHNRACVRLEHLRAVTHAVNMANFKRPKTLCKYGHTKKLAPRGQYACYVCLTQQVKKWRDNNPVKARAIDRETKRKWRLKLRA